MVASSVGCDALSALEMLIGYLSGLTDIGPYVERSAGFKPAASWCLPVHINLLPMFPRRVGFFRDSSCGVSLGVFLCV